MAIEKINFSTTASLEVQAEELYNFFNTYGKEYFDTVEDMLLKVRGNA